MPVYFNWWCLEIKKTRVNWSLLSMQGHELLFHSSINIVFFFFFGGRMEDVGDLQVAEN